MSFAAVGRRLPPVRLQRRPSNWNGGTERTVVSLAFVAINIRFGLKSGVVSVITAQAMKHERKSDK